MCLLRDALTFLFPANRFGELDLMTSKSLLERHTKPEEIDLESSCPIPSVDGVIKIEWDDAPFGHKPHA